MEKRDLLRKIHVLEDKAQKAAVEHLKELFACQDSWMAIVLKEMKQSDIVKTSCYQLTQEVIKLRDRNDYLEQCNKNLNKIHEELSYRYSDLLDKRNELDAQVLIFRNKLEYYKNGLAKSNKMFNILAGISVGIVVTFGLIEYFLP